MKLDANTRLVLYWIEMNAAASIPSIARSLKLREGLVRYQISLLKDRGILKRKRTFINSSVLGYSNYVVYFSLGFGGNQEKFLSSLSSHPQVWWMAEIGGNYQYAVSMSALSIHEIIEAFEKITDKHNVCITKKEISIRIGVDRFSRKYLVHNPKNIRTFHLGKTSDEIVVDQIDKKVLRTLSYRDEMSQRELAQKENIPLATFERRLKNLEINGIIQGYFYETDLSSLGVQQYVFLLETKGFSKEFADKIYDFSQKHSLVRKLVSCVGRWDYELEINITNYSEIKLFRNDLCSNFDNEIADISMYPLIKHKSTPPFDLIVSEE